MTNTYLHHDMITILENNGFTQDFLSIMNMPDVVQARDAADCIFGRIRDGTVIRKDSIWWKSHVMLRYKAPHFLDTIFEGVEELDQELFCQRFESFLNDQQLAGNPWEKWWTMVRVAMVFLAIGGGILFLIKYGSDKLAVDWLNRQKPSELLWFLSVQAAFLYVQAYFGFLFKVHST